MKEERKIIVVIVLWLCLLGMGTIVIAGSVSNAVSACAGLLKLFFEPVVIGVVLAGVIMVTAVVPTMITWVAKRKSQ